ncbi:fatty acid synthase [Ceraceosorus bombacis]|uniref:Fatty acid synthase n=1 Tax=Ceraceosorus bombacis TaxID=401625 RepID=A0A0P1B895_9BASI|nr:fatty acid synthase [Ceraceosorus bombacis]
MPTSDFFPGSPVRSDEDYVDISGSPLLISGQLSEGTLRPIQLSTRISQVRVPVPTQPYEAWITAIVQLEARIALAARFLGFLAAKLNETQRSGRIASAADQRRHSVASRESSRSTSPSQKPGAMTHESNILQCAWAAFNQQFLVRQLTDLHKVTATFDSDLRTEVLRSYYDALVVLERAAGSGEGAVQKPALQTPLLLSLAAKKQAGIFAIFGGQGNNEVYFDELQELFNTYRPLVAPLLQAATEQLQALIEEATLNGFESYYVHQADVFGWLTGRTAKPPTSYLASIPLSLPLIGLTQLTQFLVSCRASGLSPGQFRDRVLGATGHSQGIVAALVLATSDDEPSFIENCVKALGLLFHIGKRGQESFPALSLDAALVADSVEGGEGEPTPMLSVQGLAIRALEGAVAAVNKHIQDAAHRIDVSLFNGPSSFVVTGPPRSLFGLVGHLRSKRADPNVDQSKLPWSKRKPVFTMRFLPVGVPYHSSHLLGATEKVASIDYQEACIWRPRDLKTVVRNTYDGSDMSSYAEDTSLLRSICDQIFTHHIHWTKACDVPPSTTHCVDFGTGGLSGIGGLTLRNLEGRGVRVVTVSGRHRYSPELYDVAAVQRERPWSEFAPKLVKTPNGLQLDTPLSRILGRPPITVGGMTPTTVQAGINAATAQAGYHIELAGGGHYNAKMLRDKIDTLQDQVDPGVGFTLNSLYINQRQFSVQYPEWLAMRREGYPLQGFTCAAGIPSPEKAKEMIEGLQAAGLRHITFKPGSVDGIRQVCTIAEKNPTFGIILCWTGGRAGGHHSPEDMHSPILSTYGRIRAHSNLALVGGSGFGSADDFWPYLTGDWSKDKFGTQPMPFDGVMFGSWIMVAKEAHTADPVKELIVKAPGCGDEEWETTHGKDGKSGIISVVSELGERIHVVQNRCTDLWRELDEKLFSL